MFIYLEMFIVQIVIIISGDKMCECKVCGKMFPCSEKVGSDLHSDMSAICCNKPKPGDAIYTCSCGNAKNMDMLAGIPLQELPCDNCDGRMLLQQFVPPRPQNKVKVDICKACHMYTYLIITDGDTKGFSVSCGCYNCGFSEIKSDMKVGVAREMPLNTYQLVSGRTAIYPGSGEFMGLAYVTSKLASEAGEVSGKFGKMIRDNNGVLDYKFRKMMIDELGDVMWYVQQCCTELGVTLEDVCNRNIHKLSDRKERGKLHGDGDKR